MSQYLSVGSSSRSGGRDRSRSPSSSRSQVRAPSSSRRPELRRDVLPEVRVLDNSRNLVFDTPPIPQHSPSFRFAVFVMHFAISLLESDSGRAALIKTGNKVYNGWTHRMKKEVLFGKDKSINMDQAVDHFLANIRQDPPNVLISSRISGEGEVMRLNWPNAREKFEAKWGAVFLLNKIVVDNAINAATLGHKEQFQRFLFLMGMSATHELVHAFVGLLTGTNRMNTPPPANYPRPGDPGSLEPAGESGYYFEGALAGFIAQAYQRDPKHQLRNRQAGELFAYTLRPSGTAYYHLDTQWMLDRLALNFHANSFPAPVSSWRPAKKTNADIAMEEARDQPYGQTFAGLDLGDWVAQVNSMPTVRVGSAELREIMAMAFRPEMIRARV